MLNQLNLNYLRIFLAVYRTGSMTKAAQELHLTQSGISQQIKALEDTLGVTLFDRINRRIIPTAKADALYVDCVSRLEELDAILERVTAQKNVLEGKVKIGFPPVFGNHEILPLVARFARRNPSVKFELRTGASSDLLGLLFDGRLDFVFTEAVTKDPHLVTEAIAEEGIDLCWRKDLLQSFGTYKKTFGFFQKLPFVAYVEGEPVIRSWFKHQFGRVPTHLNVVATVIDSHAIARIVLEGMAAGLLPDALIRQVKQENSEIQILSTKKRLSNQIWVCRLGQRSLSTAAHKCFNEIKHHLG